VLLLRSLSLRGVTTAALASRANKAGSGGRAGRANRVGTTATVTPLWSYPSSSHTEGRYSAERFSSTAQTIGSTSSDTSRLEGHHGQAGLAAEICGL
jgi:hypothetical protein